MLAYSNPLHMKTRTFIAITAAALAGAAAFAERAETGMRVSDNHRALWDDPYVKARIERGIEENRKGDFKISFDKPVENLKAELVRHEFVFGAPTMALAATRGESGGMDMERVSKMKKPGVVQQAMALPRLGCKDGRRERGGGRQILQKTVRTLRG